MQASYLQAGRGLGGVQSAVCSVYNVHASTVQASIGGNTAICNTAICKYAICNIQASICGNMVGTIVAEEVGKEMERT